MSEKPTYKELSEKVKELQESIEAYRLAVSNLPDLFYRTDLEGRISYISPSVHRLSGYTVEEAIGMKMAEEIYLFPEERKNFISKLEEEGRVENFEAQLKRKDGSVWWGSTNARILKDKHGKILGIEGVARDISEIKAAEDSLRESEERFRLAFHTSPDAINLNRASDGMYLDINQGFTLLTGYTRKDVAGKTSLEINIWKNSADRERLVTALMDTGVVNNFEAQFVRKTGEVGVGLMSARIFSIKKEKIILSVTRDISDRRKAEEELRQSEERNRIIFDNAPIGIIMSDPDGAIISANQAAQVMSGYRLDELLRMNTADSYSEQRDRTILCEKLENEASVREYPARLKRKDGTEYIALLNIDLIDFDDQKVLLMTQQDITEQKRTAEALKKSEELYRLITENVTDVLWIRDMNLNLTYISPSIMNQQGYTVEEAINRSLEETFTPDSLKLINAVFKEELGIDKRAHRDLNRSRTIEVEVKCKNESTIWAEIKMSFLRDSDGNAIGIIGVTRNVSERKRAEEKAKAHDDRFKSIFSSVYDAIFVHPFQEEGFAPFIEVNDIACKRYGYSRDEFLKLTPKDITKKVDSNIHAAAQHRKRLFDEKHLVFETVHIKKTGEEFPVEISSNIVDQNGLPVILAVVRDITERKRAEETRKRYQQELERQNIFIHTILDNLPIGLAVNYINEGTSTYINKKFEEIYGWPKHELENVEEFFVKVYPDPVYREKIKKQIIEDIQSGNPDRMVWDGITVTGENGTKKIVSAKNIPLDQQNIMISTVQDVTESKKLQQQLQQAQKMEAIGSLAGGIAHDFNNILFPIVGLSEMLMEDLPADSPEHLNAKEILNAGRRGSDLVQQILTFSRQAELKTMPVRIQKILKEVIKLCQSSIPSYIKISHDIQENCAPVMANPTQVHQIVMNLVTNAYHAIEPENGEILVELRAISAAEDASFEEGIKPGQYVKLTISDTGTGIDPGIMDKIFDPYFTTKDQGRGTGLGLAVVYGIVKEYGGEIRVFSEPGIGTTFNVYLPVIENVVDPKTLAQVKKHKTGSERILLVDDEKSIVQLETKMLERLGYGVTSRVSSIEALNLFKEKKEDYDLVITDMTMPNMTGDKLATELISIRPDIPVIICTGFSERMNEKIAKSIGAKGIIMKPVAMFDLSEKVREVLDKAKG